MGLTSIVRTSRWKGVKGFRVASKKHGVCDWVAGSVSVLLR